jgi:hypothetical protein
MMAQDSMTTEREREKMSKSHPFCRVPIQADDYLCECEKEDDNE